MATQQPLVLSNTGKIKLPLSVAERCAQISGNINHYDPDGRMDSVVCVGVKVPLPQDCVKLSDWALLHCESHHRLWTCMTSLDPDYKYPPIPMKLLREGEFQVPMYTWVEVKEMVLATHMVVEDDAIPAHITQSVYSARGLPMGRIGGVVVVSGGIMNESDASCLENKPTNPKYDGIGLMEVIKDEPPFAVIANMADHFYSGGGRVWIFKD